MLHRMQTIICVHDELDYTLCSKENKLYNPCSPMLLMLSLTILVVYDCG